MKDIHNSSFPKKFNFYLFSFVQFYEECFFNVFIDICNFNLDQIKFNNTNIHDFIESEIKYDIHKYILQHEYRENFLLLLITLVTYTFGINIYLNIPSEEGVSKIYKHCNDSQKEKGIFQTNTDFITFSTKLNYNDFFYFLYDKCCCIIYPNIFGNIEKGNTNYEETFFKLVNANFKRMNQVARKEHLIRKKNQGSRSRADVGSNIISTSTLSGCKSSDKHSEIGKFSDK